ncbi:MAG: DMT family transporter [Clostridia bacterium]|nr:DMT family transporter [Clostridia bacterium]
MLLSAAVIWGLSFVVQSEGLQYIGGFTLTGLRMLLATLVLLPVIAFRRSADKKRGTVKKYNKKTCAAAIIIVGVFITVGVNLQQAAFAYIEVGKVGFITAFYMLLVPIFGLFLRKRPPFTVWIAVIIGLCGLFMINGGADFTLSFGKGEILTFAGAVAFALHIVAIDYFADRIDSYVLSAGQFFVCGVLSCILMFIFEEPNIEAIKQAAVPILYTGILSSGVAFTFQIVGQKYTEPTIASMLLCTESVFSVLFAFLILHQELTTFEYIGCGIMFAAIILAQIPVGKNRNKSLS